MSSAFSTRSASVFASAALCAALSTAGVAFAAPPAKAPAKAAAPQRVVSGDWTISATETEGKAKNARTGEEIRLYGKDEGCEYDVFRGKVLSVVGTFVSFELDEGSYCGGASPSHSTTLTTVDLARGGSPLPLTQLVSLATLRATLKDDGWLKKQAAAGKPCNLAFLPYTSAFSFHHLQGKQAALRLQVPEDCETGRANATRLGFVVSLPSWLLPRLQAADKAGTLHVSTARPKHR